jgi:site-specific recombinase XerD
MVPSLGTGREHGVPLLPDALFLNAAGRRLSTQGIANVITRVFREMGIERRVTPHMFRHYLPFLTMSSDFAGC